MVNGIWRPRLEHVEPVEDAGGPRRGVDDVLLVLVDLERAVERGAKEAAREGVGETRADGDRLERVERLVAAGTRWPER